MVKRYINSIPDKKYDPYLNPYTGKYTITINEANRLLCKYTDNINEVILNCVMDKNDLPPTITSLIINRRGVGSVCPPYLQKLSIPRGSVDELSTYVCLKKLKLRGNIPLPIVLPHTLTTLDASCPYPKIVSEYIMMLLQALPVTLTHLSIVLPDCDARMSNLPRALKKLTIVSNRYNMKHDDKFNEGIVDLRVDISEDTNISAFYSKLPKSLTALVYRIHFLGFNILDCTEESYLPCNMLYLVCGLTSEIYNNLPLNIQTLVFTDNTTKFSVFDVNPSILPKTLTTLRFYSNDGRICIVNDFIDFPPNINMLMGIHVRDDAKYDLSHLSELKEIDVHVINEEDEVMCNKNDTYIVFPCNIEIVTSNCSYPVFTGSLRKYTGITVDPSVIPLLPPSLESLELTHLYCDIEWNSFPPNLRSLTIEDVTNITSEHLQMLPSTLTKVTIDNVKFKNTIDGRTFVVHPAD